jgi:hypothetical protein
MAQKRTNSEVWLCPYGLLVINPQSRLGEADLPRLMPSLASMIRGQRAHIPHPHCMVAKDHDEGSDLFMIEACVACPSTA